MKRIQVKHNRGFTLVELLVVIGIISLLISLLMPTLSAARLQSQRIKCLSNERQIGVYMQLYANDNNGLLIPLGPLLDGSPQEAASAQAICVNVPGYDQGAQGDGAGGSPPYQYMTLGSQVFPWCRWPYLLIKSTGYARIPTTGQAQYLLYPPPTNGSEDPMGMLTSPWTPGVMVCPSDPQPASAHSYLFNEHLVQDQQKVLTYAARPPAGQSDSQVVVLGEKRSTKDDYYMEAGDFPTDTSVPADTHVELYRHGLKLGSNYLYKDFHAENKPPKALSDEVDPWDITPVDTKSAN